MDKTKRTSSPLWFDVRVWIIVFSTVEIALGSIAGICFYLGAEAVTKYEGLRFAVGVFALLLGLGSFIEAIMGAWILCSKAYLFHTPKFAKCGNKETQTNKQRSETDKRVY